MYLCRSISVGQSAIASAVTDFKNVSIILRCLFTVLKRVSTFLKGFSEGFLHILSA